MTTSVQDMVVNFITNAEAYQSQAISDVFTYTSQAITNANNVNWVQLNLSPWEKFIWNTPIQDPYNKSDIPAPDNMFVYLDMYLQDWMNKYRLLMKENFSTALPYFELSNNKLMSIVNDGFLIPLTIRQQIIGRGIDEESFSLNQQIDDIKKDFSSKGWSIPSSYLQNRMDKVTQDAYRKMSSLNRDVAIKEQELYNEMLKLALQIGTDELPKCVEIASSFAAKYSQLFNIGAENVKNYIYGLSVVDQSIKNYQTTLLSRVQTAVQESQSWRNYDLDAKYKQSQFELQKVDYNVKTTLGVVDALTRIGTAALSANQSIVQLNSQYLQATTGTTVV